MPAVPPALEGSWHMEIGVPQYTCLPDTEVLKKAKDEPAAASAPENAVDRNAVERMSTLCAAELKQHPQVAKTVVDLKEGMERASLPGNATMVCVVELCLCVHCARTSRLQPWGGLRCHPVRFGHRPNVDDPGRRLHLWLQHAGRGEARPEVVQAARHRLLQRATALEVHRRSLRSRWTEREERNGGIPHVFAPRPGAARAHRRGAAPVH